MSKLYRIDTRRRITLPDDILKELKAKSGDYISFETKNGKIELRKVHIS